MEPPYALCTVVPKKRAARQAASPVVALAAVEAGGGDEVRSGGAERRAAHSRPTTGDTAGRHETGWLAKLTFLRLFARCRADKVTQK